MDSPSGRAGPPGIAAPSPVPSWPEPQPGQPAKADPVKPTPSPAKNKGDPAREKAKQEAAAALTAAAIAAILVQESRRAYYATGRPCACPDDMMRNGRSCGGKSAYSRPGSARLLCHPSDVPAAMIEKHRARISAASRKTSTQ
jgi:hypothetical protein